MEVTKKDVTNLIEVRKSDSFLNHLWGFIVTDYRAQGEISKNCIKVWKQNFWNRGFYPVFKFEFNAAGHLINIKGKINPISKCSIILLPGIFLLIVILNLDEFNFLNHWIIILVIIIFFSIFFFVFQQYYSFEKQNQLNEIFEQLDIEQKEPKAEREWTLKNTIIRMFTYPFSLFLIGFGLYISFNTSELKVLGAGIGGMAIAAIYLYADLKMIL